MSRFDRDAAAYRAAALRSPLTRANRLVHPAITLPGGIRLGLSVNK